MSTRSSKLLTDKGGNAADLAICDLVTLIKWQAPKKVPADTSLANKPAVVKAWVDLKVAPGVLQAQADLHAPAPAAVRTRAPAAAGRRSKKTLGDDEEEDGEDESDEEEEEDEEDEDVPDEADEDAEAGCGEQLRRMAR